MFEGYQDCLALLDSGKIKIGRILAMVRSFEHHAYRETGKQILEDNLLSDAMPEWKDVFMPAWRGILGQTDVEALVSYIRLLSH